MRSVKITVYYPTDQVDVQCPPRTVTLTEGEPNTWQAAAPTPEGRERKYVLPRSERQPVSLDNLIGTDAEQWEVEA